MHYVSVAVVIAVSAHIGHGSSAGANQPNPLIERQVSVRGQMLCGGVPAKNVSVLLLLVDFDNIPQSTKNEEWGEMEKPVYDAPLYPVLVEGGWYYGTIDEADVDEEGRFEVGGKALVAGKDDRRFAFQLGVIHYCKNGTEQPERRSMLHFATIRFASSSKKSDVYDFDLANHLELRDPYDYPD